MAKKKAEKVVVEIIFADKTLRGEGETVLDALESITPPIKIFLKGTIRVSEGDKQFERTWIPKRMRRVFRPLSQAFVAKELTYLLK